MTLPIRWKRRRSVTATIAEADDAVLAAGAPEEKARAAAWAIADHNSRFKQNRSLVLKWITGAIVAGVISLMLQTFA